MIPGIGVEHLLAKEKSPEKHKLCISFTTNMYKDQVSGPQFHFQRDGSQQISKLGGPNAKNTMGASKQKKGAVSTRIKGKRISENHKMEDAATLHR